MTSGETDSPRPGVFGVDPGADRLSASARTASIEKSTRSGRVIGASGRISEVSRPDPVVLPPTFDAFRGRGPQWAQWLDGLPRLASDVLSEWQLTRDGAPDHGWGSLVLPVRDEDGRPLALKLTFPQPDTAGEIPALKAWRGHGAVRLDRADPRRGALLLQRLGPADLNSIGDHAACQVLGELYGTLHRPAPPTVPALACFVEGWLAGLEALGRQAPAPPRFVQQAVRLGRDLAADLQRPHAELRIVHGDLHGGNVLAAPDGWLAIDPGGFAGDPCYEPGPLLWNRWDELAATGDVGDAVRRRFWAITDAAGLDEGRARDWTIVRAMISLYWRVEDSAGRELDAGARDWITRCVTVVKAMQEVRAW